MTALQPTRAHLLILTLLAMATGWIICWLVVRFPNLHGRFSTDHVDSGVQKFHAQPTPRIGGLGIAAGVLAGTLLVCNTAWFPQTTHDEFIGLVLASVPAFLGGLIEDVTRKVGPRARLMMTMVSGALGISMLGATISRLDIPIVDLAFRFYPIGVILTMFAVGGVSNAVNIIDGFNGLASGVVMIMLVGIATVAAMHADLTILAAAMAMAGVVVGFLYWNWPHGRIFLGDGGAYLLGFWVAELAILLVARHPDITAWFPVLLMIHPIMETLFSVYRRTFLRGRPSTHADAMHLHQLVYARLVRIYVGSRAVSEKTKRNSATALYFWVASLITTASSVVLTSFAIVSFLVAFVACAAYVLLYRRLIHWNSPQSAMLREWL